MMEVTGTRKDKPMNRLCVMTEESILSFLRAEKEKGIKESGIRQYKRATYDLFQWLPEEKLLTKAVLLTWRAGLEEKGYASETVYNYVKWVNRYLDYMGWAELRFNRGKPKDLTGWQFGYLTALEPTEETKRKNRIWRCQCKCGNEIEVPTSRLLCGNTISCGCLLKEQLQQANMYYGGTSIRQALEEQVISKRAKSGFVGVTERKGKWRAQICYKGQNYALGTYSKLEDAIAARARAKELVQEDALKLLENYKVLHEKDQPLPSRDDVLEAVMQSVKTPEKNTTGKVMRSNNTSGCTGVTRHRNQWVAKITYQKVTYQLGSFSDQESAIRARREAEQALKTEPEQFVKAYTKAK